MKKFGKTDQGLIKWFVLIIIALIIMGYYGFSLRQAIESPTTQDNLRYFKDICLWLWDNILKLPSTFVWEHILMPLIHSLSKGS
jgi:hypothetical protein